MLRRPDADLSITKPRVELEDFGTGLNAKSDVWSVVPCLKVSVSSAGPEKHDSLGVGEHGGVVHAPG